ncbi:P-loop NTPase fold protein [Gynuella sunshinyii]|uniref:ATPase involved in DNA repair n=1 Tax=Gynuella sunshinyii YC6258 TaxID=1445510 RepID=A0A0C5VD96_9GAMM|nr:P-loop NTPase fold protein [Gynuella sunshinyii]AJQ97290.1 ATPase involved in DNA repair [Gynuella sunshinyii YC6258]
MMNPEQLSPSSQSVFWWATALAQFRVARHNETSVSISASDILVGMLLESPTDPTTTTLLTHFHLTPGQILPDDYLIPTRQELERQLRSIPADTTPAFDSDADYVLKQAYEIAAQNKYSQVLELPYLLIGLLQSPNTIAEKLAELFAQRGIEISQVQQLSLEFFSQPENKQSYAEFLQTRLPYHASPVDIPNYKADHGNLNDLTQDLVGIRAEVDAFAYLLASRGLKPPLAVGLFGEWGSGKSFFMQAVRSRIEQLTGSDQISQRSQVEVPYWKRIIHIEFNAWHYVEGNLWASLVDHIFNQLRLKGEKEDLVEKRRNYWLQQLDSKRVELAELESKYSVAKRDLDSLEQRMDLLEQAYQTEMEHLRQLKANASSDVVIRDSLNAVSEVLDNNLLALGLPSARDIFKKLDEAHQEIKRGRRLLTELWHHKHRSYRYLLVLAGLFPPAVTWMLTSLTESMNTAWLSGAAATVATGTALLSKTTLFIKDRLKQLQQASAKVQQEVMQQQQQLDNQITAAEQTVANARQRLHDSIHHRNEVLDSIEEIQDELKKVTPTQILNEFVKERVGSGDYRKHLGIPALIQQDFQQLATLISGHNQALVAGDDSDNEAHDDYGFNRIILYIDDLDRCPDTHVVQVLQAVHLLLAFELFVVVVAVDSRWLSHALIKHFDALAPEHNNTSTASPDDYLEKIFQVPFWVQPLNDHARQNIINGLLEGHLLTTRQPPGGQFSSDSNIPNVSESHQQILDSLNPASAPPELDVAALSIHADELDFLKQLTPLLGNTPRATKRFVNLYQLLRIIHHLTPENDEESPPDYQLLGFMLAIGGTVPNLEQSILMAEQQNPYGLLSDVLNNLEQLHADRIQLWMDSRIHWLTIPLARIQHSYHRVERFLFRVSSGSLSGLRSL